MKAKVLFLISMLLLAFTRLTAQPITINESDVPQDVFISFKYKYPDATVKEWQTDKGNFLAKFSIAEQQAVAEFTANGKWVVSRFTIAEKELPSPIMTYYKQTYKPHEFVITLSELVKEESGNTYYYLQTKKSGISQPKPTELFFDLSGNLTNKIEPEENKIIEEIKVEETKKDTTEGKEDFSKKELPTSINNYIKANYPDFGIKDSKFFYDPDMGDVYYIILKQQGFKDQVELYFDINGVLVKQIDSREIKAKKVVEQKDATVKPDSVIVAEKQKIEETKKKLEGQPVDINKVPAVAKTHLATKVKKITNISWYRVERDFVARFTVNGKKGQATYTEDGVWKETRLETDEASLNPIAINYLRDKYRRYRTIKVEYVQSSPKNKFYEVDVVEKYNKTEDPPVTKVFFDANGKFSSEEKPQVDNPNDQYMDKRKEEQDKEFLSNVDSKDQKIESGTGVNEKVNPKELPTDAITYIRKNFPIADYKIKESRYLFDDDLNANVYYVTVKKEGERNEVELYFDLSGKLLKKIDPAEQKANNEITNENVNIDENQSQGAEKIDPKELPSSIKNYLKQKYPEHKVQEATYMTDEELGNVYFLVLKKQGTKAVTNLYFDLNGKLVKSEQPSDN